MLFHHPVIAHTAFECRSMQNDRNLSLKKVAYNVLFDVSHPIGSPCRMYPHLSRCPTENGSISFAATDLPFMTHTYLFSLAASIISDNERSTHPDASLRCACLGAKPTWRGMHNSPSSTLQASHSRRLSPDFALSTPSETPPCELCNGPRRGFQR